MEQEELIKDIRKAAVMIQGILDVAIKHTAAGIITHQDQVAAISLMVKDDIQKYILDKIDNHETNNR